jgi:hypothetical protein
MLRFSLIFVRIEPPLLDNTDFRVPVRNVRDATTFSVTHKISPSARCAKAVNLVCSGVDIVRQPITLFKNVCNN